MKRFYFGPWYVMPLERHSTGQSKRKSKLLYNGFNLRTMRNAFKMKIKPGMAEEYKRRHDAIWPELVQLLNESGITEYSIFLDNETNSLFAVQNVVGAESSQDLGQHVVVQKWWAFMADIMETHDDHSPISIPLTEVFYMK